LFKMTYTQPTKTSLAGDAPDEREAWTVMILSVC
jgi:hypothetical protein